MQLHSTRFHRTLYRYPFVLVGQFFCTHLPFLSLALFLSLFVSLICFLCILAGILPPLASLLLFFLSPSSSVSFALLVYKMVSCLGDPIPDQTRDIFYVTLVGKAPFPSSAKHTKPTTQPTPNEEPMNTGGLPRPPLHSLPPHERLTNTHNRPTYRLDQL